MKDKLKVKVWNYKNVVLYEVLEQDESLRNAEEIFTSSNGWEIRSVNLPAIDKFRNIVYIKGNERKNDKRVEVLKMSTIREAERVVKEVRQAVKEFNESQNQILDEKEKEYLSGVIKPFRNKVNYIMKDSFFDKEWIDLDFGDHVDECLSFPQFKKGSMYKGMEAGKEYTLEELGL